MRSSVRPMPEIGVLLPRDLPAEQVQAIREQRAQAAQAQQTAALQEQQANTAAKLASAKTGDEANALTDITQAFSGYT